MNNKKISIIAGVIVAIAVFGVLTVSNFNDDVNSLETNIPVYIPGLPTVFAELSLNDQITQGIPTEELQCRNSDHLLVMRDNGNLACVSEKTAQKTNWEIINQIDIEQTIPVIPIINERFDAIPQVSKGLSSSIASLCYDGFPKNLSVEMPVQVVNGEPFDVTVSYTFIEYDPQDIAESEATGIPLTLDDADTYDTNDNPNCPEELSIFHSNKTEILNEEFTFYDESYSETYRKTTVSHLASIPFTYDITNTWTISMIVNESLDTRDGMMSFGTVGNFIYIYGESINDTTLFSDIPIPALQQTLESDDFITVSSLEYTDSTISALESILVSYEREETPTYSLSFDQIIVPNDNNDEPSYPPLVESWADFLRNSTDKGNMTMNEWLLNESYPQDYIDDLFEAFPDLAAQFILFLNFDIPEAHAAAPSQVYVYGTLTYDDTIDVPLEEITICAYDRDESNPDSENDELLYNGATPVCDTSDKDGFYSLAILTDDPNDSDEIDLVLYLSVTNNDFEFINYNHADYVFPIINGDSNIEMDVDYSFLVFDSSSEKLDLNLYANTHFVKAGQILNKLIDSRDHIESEYSYIMPSIKIYFTEDYCMGTEYFPVTNNIRLDGSEDSACVTTPIYLSDTPKHEYYHFYTDEIYSEKNNGDLPDDTYWIGGHTPLDRLPAEQAWIEGVATGFVLLENNNYEYQSASASYPFNYEDGYVTYDDNTIEYFSEGITSEGQVSKLFYDLIDNTPTEQGDDSDQIDNINLDVSDVNNVFDDTLNSGESVIASTVEDFISDWEDENGLPDINNVLFLNTLIDEIPVDEETEDETEETTSSTSFFEDFENGLSNWTLTGDDDWETMSPQVYDVPDSSSDNTVANGSNCDDYCIMTMNDAVDLSEYNSAVFSMSRFVDSSSDKDEGIVVYASNNNGDNWTEIFSWLENNDENDNDWHYELFDLSDYLSSQFKIRIVSISSNYSEDNEIDNISIIGSDAEMSDIILPVITLLGSTSISIQVGETYVEYGYTATDDTDGDITSSVVITGTVDTTIPGTYLVIYDVSDSSGNTASVTRTVNVVDIIIPTLTLIGDNLQTIEIGESYEELGATASDNFDGDITDSIVIDYSNIILDVEGTYYVTYDVSDSSGNTASVTRTVQVVLADEFVIFYDDFETDMSNWDLKTDDDEYWSIKSPSKKDVPDSESGNKVAGADDCDNYCTMIMKDSINLRQTSSPTLSFDRYVSLFAESSEGLLVYVSIGNNWITLEKFVADEDDDGQWHLEKIDLSKFDSNSEFKLKFVAKSNNGNEDVELDNIRIYDADGVVDVDATIPEITLIGDNPQSMDVGETYVEYGYTATDDTDGDITSSVVITGTINTSIIGTYTLYYDVTDNSGNAATQVSRAITIVDTINPTLTPSDDYTAEATSILTPLSTTDYGEPTVTDNYDDISSITITSNAPDTFPLGITMITWAATDSSGNTDTNYQLITLQDTIIAEITITGDNPQSMDVGESYVEYGATATDNIDGDITDSIVITNPVDTSIAGTYYVTYDVSDSSGNDSTATRTIHVISTAPLTVPDRINVGAATIIYSTSTSFTVTWPEPYDGGSEITSYKYSLDTNPEYYAWGGEDLIVTGFVDTTSLTYEGYFKKANLTLTPINEVGEGEPQRIRNIDAGSTSSRR